MTSNAEPIKEDEAVHRLKNQLSIILGFCELLMEEFPADSAHRRDLGEIYKAAREAMTEMPDINKRLS